MINSNPANCSIINIKGIGPKRAETLSRLGITTVKDAFYYLPFRYEDRGNLKKIAEVSCGCLETIQGKIISTETRALYAKRLKIFEAVISDGSGLLKAMWFNRPFMNRNLLTGYDIVLSGVVKESFRSGGYLIIENPEYEFVTDDPDSCIHTNRVVPVYRLTEGLTQKVFRKFMFQIIETFTAGVTDPVPAEILSRNGLPHLADSLRNVHFPEGPFDIDALNNRITLYHSRISFDELFLMQLGNASLRVKKRAEIGISFHNQGMLRKKLCDKLPFELTEGQKDALRDIMGDMKNPWPMNRLLQGDVGCGKTVVALISMLNAVESGYQAVLMAPTEVLAEQHYMTISQLTEDLGLSSVLLVGGKGPAQEKITHREADIIIGTHALIQEGLKFAKLGIAVIDEQHKFGVAQRALLRKKGDNPDVLVMTATPIPRSLALTIYGDLDCTTIRETISRRKAVCTQVFKPDQKALIYKILEDELRKGRQAYVVYPSIDQSENPDLKSAVNGKKAFQRLFPEYRVGLIHGRIAAAERASIMNSFRRKEIDLLICTTVIEVGVDVPDATVIVIIHAERFGLSQLHQLRGRVGRGGHSSWCLLVAGESCSEDASRRLDILSRNNDGLSIAEEDLALRGHGEFFGTRQAGLTDLKVSDIVKDMDLLRTAKREAFALIAAHPDLHGFPLLREALGRFWNGNTDIYRNG